MTQLALFPVRAWVPTAPCAFGETGADWHGPHHCAACAAAVAAAVATLRQGAA